MENDGSIAVFGNWDIYHKHRRFCFRFFKPSSKSGLPPTRCGPTATAKGGVLAPQSLVPWGECGIRGAPMWCSQICFLTPLVFIPPNDFSLFSRSQMLSYHERPFCNCNVLTCFSHSIYLIFIFLQATVWIWAAILFFHVESMVGDLETRITCRLQGLHFPLPFWEEEYVQTPMPLQKMGSLEKQQWKMAPWKMGSLQESYPPWN